MCSLLTKVRQDYKLLTHKVLRQAEAVKEKIIPIKNNIKKQATKLRWVLHIKEIKNVTEEEAFTANKPRYSYWSKQK